MASIDSEYSSDRIIMDSCEFSLGSSRLLQGLLLIIYSGAIALLFSITIPLAVKWGGIALICYGLKQKLSLQANRSSVNAILFVWQDSKGRWGCQTRSRHCYRGVVLADSFISPLLVVLRLSILNRIITILIPRDALALGEYRTLCSRLLFFSQKTLK